MIATMFSHLSYSETEHKKLEWAFHGFSKQMITILLMQIFSITCVLLLFDF